MMLVSRLIGRIDARLLIAIGLIMCAGALWDTTLFTLDVSEDRVIWNGVVLGFGLGLVFPPLTTLTFATIPPRLRTEGAAMNALLRNLGASVGIAVLVSMLARSTQTNRSEMAEHLTPWSGGWPFGSSMPGAESTLLHVWDLELNRQAAMIGYLNDFRVMTLCTVIVIPLLLFMRGQTLFPVR